MPNVRGCHLPEELLYDVENHTWFSEVGDGNVRIGMTTIATAMAGQLVAFTPKKVGRSVKAGKSCATIESGKWVGPAKSLAAGEVVEINEDMVETPNIANDDPYGRGWLVILKPEDWAPGTTTWWLDTDGVDPGEAGCHIGTDSNGVPNGRMFGEACLSEELLVESNPGADQLHSHENDIGHPDTFDCAEWCREQGAESGRCEVVAAPPCAKSARCACD